MEIVKDYGDWIAEHAALRESAGVLDLSFRSRICLVGDDRVRFLHGQVTNDIKKLRVGEGCYSALTTAKGKMESDLNIFNLPDELLLDFEPGLAEKISARLEKFIVADDVQIVDAAPHYGLLSVQGPKAENIIRALELSGWGETPSSPNQNVMKSGLDGVSPHQIPAAPFNSVKISDSIFGEIYLINQPRLGSSWWGENPSDPNQNAMKSGFDGASSRQKLPASGFDLFVPKNSFDAFADKLIAAAKSFGGRKCGWTAFETARIEAGIPRFGSDMDETNLPLECGIENRAMSFNKGCYIGQEVLNRIHSFGHVTKELRGLRLADDLKMLPKKGDKLFRDGKEIGYITSAAKSPKLRGEGANIALGYVRREANQIGNELKLRSAAGESSAKIMELPFVK